MRRAPNLMPRKAGSTYNDSIAEKDAFVFEKAELEVKRSSKGVKKRSCNSRRLSCACKKSKYELALMYTSSATFKLSRHVKEITISVTPLARGRSLVLYSNAESSIGGVHRNLGLLSAFFASLKHLCFRACLRGSVSGILPPPSCAGVGERTSGPQGPRSRTEPGTSCGAVSHKRNTLL